MPFCHAGQVWCFGQYYRASNEKFFPVHGVRAAVLSGQTWSSATGALRTMARHGRSEETLKLTIISRWLSVTIDGVGRMIALGRSADIFGSAVSLPSHAVCGLARTADWPKA
jgi:hypothetical protein